MSVTVHGRILLLHQPHQCCYLVKPPGHSNLGCILWKHLQTWKNTASSNTLLLGKSPSIIPANNIITILHCNNISHNSHVFGGALWHNYFPYDPFPGEVDFEKAIDYPERACSPQQRPKYTKRLPCGSTNSRTLNQSTSKHPNPFSPDLSANFSSRSYTCSTRRMPVYTIGTIVPSVSMITNDSVSSLVHHAVATPISGDWRLFK